MIVTDLTTFDATVLILAGGLARRFEGIDKGLLTYQNRHLVEHIAHNLSAWPCYILSHGNQQAYQALGFDCIDDTQPQHQGPMVAIWQAAKRINSQYIIVAACDSPLIPTSVYQELLAALIKPQQQGLKTHACFLTTHTRQHYCCMVAQTGAIRALASPPRSMRHLLEQLDAKGINCEVSEDQLININTKKDYQCLLQ